MTREEAVWYVNHTFEIIKEELCNSGRFDEAKEFEIAQNITIEALSTERTGEWVEHDPRTKGLAKIYECPFCGDEVIGEKTNYCPNCGAKMKGGTENE